MKQRSRVLVTAVAAVTVFALAALPARAAAGDPDTTFGGDGKVRSDFAGQFDLGQGVVIQPNGRIVAVGQAGAGPTFDSADFGVARYLDNGDPDPAFSGDGLQQTDFSGTGDSARAAAMDGTKIVVVGSSETTGGGRFAVARYGSGGALDSTFSGDGKTRTAFAGFDDSFANDIAVGDDGKAIVVGSATSGAKHLSGRGGPDTEVDFAVARYKPNGALDGTFGGGDGRVTTDFGGNDDSGQAVALLASGQFYVVGSSQTASFEQRIVVANYEANGTLDSSFSGDGKVVVNMSPGDSEHAAGIAIRPDGKILVGASVRNGATSTSEADIGVLLLNANGTIATTFGGGDGMTFADYGGVEDPDEMVRDTTGKVFFVATRPFVSAESPQAILVFRLNSGGGKDLSYGTAGKATVEFDDGVGGFGLAVDSSHRAVAVGRVGIGAGGDFAAVRLQA
jgi:uncharacterized delta-60 repeat protein